MQPLADFSREQLRDLLNRLRAVPVRFPGDTPEYRPVVAIVYALAFPTKPRPYRGWIRRKNTDLLRAESQRRRAVSILASAGIAVRRGDVLFRHSMPEIARAVMESLAYADAAACYRNADVGCVVLRVLRKLPKNRLVQLRIGKKRSNVVAVPLEILLGSTRQWADEALHEGRQLFLAQL